MFNKLNEQFYKNKHRLLFVMIIPRSLSILHKHIKSSGFYWKIGAFILLSLSTIAKADYAPMIQNANDGYVFSLDSTTSVASTPVMGTDNRTYYQVGNPFVLDKGSPSMLVTGTVMCYDGVRMWGDGLNIPSLWDRAYHRLFVYVPPIGAYINGQKAYRINSNLVMTIETPLVDGWTYGRGIYCWDSSRTVPASRISDQFPITITFYINEQIIDGQMFIPTMDIAGYVRGHTRLNQPPPFNSWPINESTMPMRLKGSYLNIPSSCKTITSTGQASTLNLRHGQLSSLSYDAIVTERVIYNCKFSALTKVRLRLDYVTDEDPQRRLPMTNSLDHTKKVYSQLTITDELTGQTGTDIKIDINDIKTIAINSHIQGTNASAGDYRGSAWLIATYD